MLVARRVPGTFSLDAEELPGHTARQAPDSFSLDAYLRADKEGSGGALPALAPGRGWAASCALQAKMARLASASPARTSRPGCSKRTASNPHGRSSRHATLPPMTRTVEAGLDIGQLGLALSLHERPTSLIIEEVQTGAWAFTQGLLPGDEVVEVNGVSVRRMAAEDVEHLEMERPLRLILKARPSQAPLPGFASCASRSFSNYSSPPLSARTHYSSPPLSLTSRSTNSVNSLASTPGSSGSGLRGEAPEKLWVLAPQKPSLQGEYKLEIGRLVNELPMWRSATGGCLASTSSGRWQVVLGDAEDAHRRGQLRSADPHGGRLPHKVRRWAVAQSGGSWSADVQRLVRITTDQQLAEHVLQEYQAEVFESAAGAPSVLWAIIPHLPKLQGQYQRRQGQAVWQQVEGQGFLFGAFGGAWMFCEGLEGVGSESAAEVRTTGPRESGVWKYRTAGGSWIADTVGGIRVTLDANQACAALTRYSL